MGEAVMPAVVFELLMSFSDASDRKGACHQTRPLAWPSQSEYPTEEVVPVAALGLVAAGVAAEWSL
jgi:hypothetical protein